MSSSPIVPRTTVVDGLTVRYAQSEASSRQDALLLSPWPESVYAFEQCWPELSRHARLVALDPPGFGGSERRDALMSPQAMGEFILRAADVLGLDRPHLVGPDIGTSSALFAAAAQPGRFRSIVVGSGGAAVPLELTGVLKEWVEAPDLAPYRQVDPAVIVDAALGTIEGYTPSEEVRADYLRSYAGDRFVESMAYARAYGEQLPRLAELLPGIETPVRIVAGARDQVVPPVNAYFLHERLPHSRVDLIDGAGHFCWEERPDAYAALVADWWEQTAPKF
ncbi:alpha/beta fold hydrolase [Streptomyces fuscigenes]|uniref:alpha/beta fold hydrolase n=1 Tax=Streptomyces fuscigenes TaxID=1528880 RepID=UPI001F3FA874|nr:alpha/beta hydrolase [Streptomyces fuscigenes]MCF3961463.1 alpha/beta hydrolase [Streptomyces fuscigenes]